MRVIPGVEIEVRWNRYDDRSWSLECKPARVDWPIWSYIGSIYYAGDDNWLSRLFNPRRFWAIVGARQEKFEQLQDAKDWVYQVGEWP